jgi:hypothetical protein
MITTTMANDILKYFFAQKSTMNNISKCYIGLSTATPSVDGSNFKEPTDANYKRVLLNASEATAYTNKMTVPTDRAIENNAEIVFPEAASGYTVTHFGIFSTETKNQGTPIYVHALTNPSGDAQPVEVKAEEVLIFRVGSLSVSFAED